MNQIECPICLCEIPDYQNYCWDCWMNSNYPEEAIHVLTPNGKVERVR